MMAQRVLAARAHQRIALANTLTKSVADRLPTSIVVGVFLGFMGLVLGPMYTFIEDTISEMMALLPPEMLRMVGNVDMSTPGGFISGEMYSMMAPAAVIYVALASGAKAFAGEVEAGTIGLLAANPVSRRRLAVDKTLAMLIHVVLASLLTFLGVWLGIAIAGLPVSGGNLAAMTLHMILLSTAAGALCTLIAVLTARRMLSLLVAAAVAFVAWVVASFLPLAESLEGLAGFSPWYHYNAADPLANGLDPVSVALLLILTAVLSAATVVAFERRDLPG